VFHIYDISRLRVKYWLNTEPLLTLTLVDCHLWFSGDCIYTSSIGTECVSSGHSGVRCASSLVVVEVLLKRNFYAISGNCLHQSAVYVQCQLEVLPNIWTLNTAPHTLFYGLVIVYWHALKAPYGIAIDFRNLIKYVLDINVHFGKYPYKVSQHQIVNDILQAYFLSQFKNNQGACFTCTVNRGSDWFSIYVMDSFQVPKRRSPILRWFVIHWS